MDNDMHTAVLDRYELGNTTIKLIMVIKTEHRMGIHENNSHVVTYDHYTIKDYAVIADRNKAQRIYDQLLQIMAAAAVLGEWSAEMRREIVEILANAHERKPK